MKKRNKKTVIFRSKSKGTKTVKRKRPLGGTDLLFLGTPLSGRATGREAARRLVSRRSLPAVWFFRGVVVYGVLGIFRFARAPEGGRAIFSLSLRALLNGSVEVARVQ